MPVEVQWANEDHTIVYLEYTGSLTWQDYDDSVDRAYDLIGTVDHPVDVISYMYPTVRLPPGDAINHVKVAFTKRPPNMRKCFLIGSDLFGEMIVRVLINIKGIQETYIPVKSVEAAHAMIAKLNQETQKS
ncbi:MAG: hypothetical protein DWB42_21225 [Chloroflexi bacterium]|nr:hypothetical protein [Chloroflexota bacterium]MDL1883954.1 hypothetical protein [Anaerolineae bacterium CFX8]